MPGIFGAISNREQSDNLISPMIEEVARLRANTFRSKLESFPWGELAVMSNPAFGRRKGIFRNTEIMVAFDGVIFNGHELGFNHSVPFPEIVANLFLSHGENFVKNLRGNFVIGIVEPGKRNLFLYTDHFGSKPLYYHQHGDDFYFGSEMKALLQVGALPKTINRSALIDTFAMGYICGEKTWLKEIHRILPGSYLRYDAGEKTFQEFNYFELKKCPEVKDALPSHQELKQKFNTAVDRIFKTTENNGYRQLMTLSGGLDSRAVAATAANLGYSNVLAMNFAESGTGDAIYAGKLAHSLGFYYLYESYDGGNWLVDFFDKSMLAGEGMYHYLDIARMIFSLRNINTEEFGTVHTGTLGDTLMGSHIKQADLERDQMPFKLGELMAAVRNRLGFGNPRGFNHLVENFGNEELISQTLNESVNKSVELIFESGMGWCESFHTWDLLNRQRAILGYGRGIEEFAEYSSPFYDVDFFNSAFNIPYNELAEQAFYIQFLTREILQPEVSRIPWDKTKTPLRRNKQLMALESRVRKLPDYLLRKLSSRPIRTGSSKPYMYWIWSNQKLREYLVDELRAWDNPDLLYIDKGKFHCFLDDWYKNPLQYQTGLLHLIYLLSVYKWLSMFGKQLTVGDYEFGNHKKFRQTETILNQ